MSAFQTVRITEEDARSGFSCGKHPLDDYFARHAVKNDQAGISRAFVRQRRDEDAPSLPFVLGFYTLSMATAESAALAPVLSSKLPRYPLPVALIGRLAVDQRATGLRLGEQLLLDALHRVLEAADLVGCVGIVVDAKDEKAETFYGKYHFVVLTAEGYPRRMFLSLATAKAAVARARTP